MEIRYGTLYFLLRRTWSRVGIVSRDPGGFSSRKNPGISFIFPGKSRSMLKFYVDTINYIFDSLYIEKRDKIEFLSHVVQQNYLLKSFKHILTHLKTHFYNGIFQSTLTRTFVHRNLCFSMVTIYIKKIRKYIFLFLVKIVSICSLNKCSWSCTLKCFIVGIGYYDVFSTRKKFKNNYKAIYELFMNNLSTFGLLNCSWIGHSKYIHLYQGCSTIWTFVPKFK